MEDVEVVKKSGEREPFSVQKVIRSMRRVGLPEELHDQVLQHIKERIRGEVTTDEIYYHIKEFLDTKDKNASIRFNLKKAIFELGPTGFPFEQYLKRALEKQGYSVETNLTLQGHCVTHEIDLLLQKDGKREIVEAKFHNQQGVKTDIQDVLYTYARYLDIRESNKIDSVWIVTNTKVSQDARRYAECKGVTAIGWNYPLENNLQELVERPSLYPVTILNGLKSEEKQKLLENDIVLCQDMLSGDIREIENKTRINGQRLKEAQENAQLVCSIPKPSSSVPIAMPL